MSVLRIADQAGVSDAGRKRRRNEDSFVIDPPLFVVADGMGGAQAGEVASRLAAAVFREFHEADDLEGAERVEATVQEANRRIYERAREDANASGMGTTVTAALVGEDTIAIGHVGDSRAYRVRGDTLEQLTDDHSLVADLVRSGRLTAEEADSHPQRSVITRALGTDLNVDVDTFVFAPEDGDIYLLCSDGLTTMVPAEQILEIIREKEGLEPAARALVKAANRSGGEDNITVVLFSVSGEGDPAAADGDTVALEDTLVELEPIADQPSSDNGWETIEHAKEAVHAPRSRRHRHRRLIVGVAVGVVVAGLIAAALWGLANAYFVGAEKNGRLAVYQGLPYDLGGGVSLYRVRYVSLLDAAQLSEEERVQLFDHDLMSYDDAHARLVELEEDALPRP